LKGDLPGKTIALRADMDALPLQEDTGLPFSSQNQGIAHSCGHDIHTAVLLGCARILNERKSALRGNVKFIFQPAEEKLSGAQQMIAAGVLKNPDIDAILALHCWPELPVGTVGLKKGAFMASSDSLDIVIKGRAGHAAHPHKSIDPIVIAGHVLTSLQTIISREVAPLDAAVITIGKINGGTAHNIIAASVEMSGTVRTISPALRARMPQMIERIVSKTAESMNGEAVVNYCPGTPPVINNDILLDLVDKAAAAALGRENIVYLESASMGGEDFAFYLEKVPGVIFRLGTANESPESRLALHNPKLIFDEKAIVTGMVALCEAALKYLNG
jgi:amidohydrolase